MKRLAGGTIGLMVALLVLVLFSQRPHFLETLELRVLDIRFLMRGRMPTSERVALVAVDAESVDRVGRWPWPRETTAELLRRICEAAPASVGMDIVFSEPQEEPWRDVLQGVLEGGGLAERTAARLRGRLAAATGDDRLAEAVASCGDRMVLGYYFEEEGSRRGLGSASAKNIFPSVLGLVRIEEQDPPFRLEEAPTVETNLDVISASAGHHGFFNMRPDPDGLVRRYQLLRSFRGDIYPALALEMARVALGAVPVRLSVGPELDVKVHLGDHEIPCDEKARLLVDWRGPGGTFEHIPAARILSGEIGPERLRGRILLVGVTEVGIKDIRATPVSTAFPGTEVHANILDSIIRNHYVRRSGNQLLLDVLSVLGIGLAMGHMVYKRRRAWAMLVLGLAAGGVVFGLNYMAFRLLGVWVNVVYPLLTVAGTYTAVALYRTVVVERRAKQTRQIFEKYVSSSIVEEVLGHPEHAVLGGQRRELTILFSDIRSFTKFSEQVEPEAVVQFLSAYLTPMTEVVLRHRGTLDKYMGDAIMAFWGAPIEDPEHASEACRAALEMGGKLAEIRRSPQAERIRDLEIGIGVNTGVVSGGTRGSERSYDYTVIGDSVNLAARLEGANKSYGTRILISENTWRQVEGAGFQARELDRVRVKGKARPVTIYELLAAPGQDLPCAERFLELFHLGLEHYYEQRFEEGLRSFHAALEIQAGDRPTLIYVNRCEAFRAEPPLPDWDGVFTMTVK